MNTQNFKKIIENTPPELKQKVIAMMDKLDKENSMTPLQKAIEQIANLSMNNDTWLAVDNILQSLLQYEQICIENAYDAGIATTNGMQTSDLKFGAKYFNQTYTIKNG